MYGEAVRRAAQRRRQHSHFRGIGPEMRVHMACAEPPQPRHDAARLRQVNQMKRPWPVGAPAHLQRQHQCVNEPNRTGREHPHARCQQARDAVLQNVARASALAQVLVVHQFIVPAAHRDSLDIESLPLQRENFASDEAMAHLRILVNQICNFHSSRPIDKMSDARPSADSRAG